MAQRLVVLADVHLGTPATQFAGQDYTYTPALLRQAVAKIGALQADRVMIVGDLVNMGLAEEYVFVTELLEPVQNRVEPMIGNHELVKGSIAEFERYWGVNAWRAIQVEQMPAILLNSGIEGLPLTQWHGRLDPQQLDFLDQRLSQANGPALVFCHHPLRNTVRRSDEPMMALENSDALRQRLGKHPHDVLLLTGHTHYQDIERFGRLTCIACPPICFWPHAFLVVDIDGRKVQIRTERLVTDPAASPDVHAGDAAYRARGEGEAGDWELTIQLT